MPKQKKKTLVGISTSIGIIMIATWVIEPLRDFVVDGILLKTLHFILKILTGIWSFLTNNHEINGFIIVFSVLAWIFIFFILFIKIKDKFFNRTVIYEDYTQDNFMGLKWSWCWCEGDIVNLWCFCPQCDYELSYSEEEMLGAIWLLAFKCEHCQKYYRFKDYNKDYLLSVIKREIHRKIRTGEKPDKIGGSNV